MFAEASTPKSPIDRFLQSIDRTAERLGLSVPAIVHLETLRQLPPGTFGRAWADFLDQNQLTAFTTGPRRKQLHDGIHILTGYGSDAIGEAEVQAFLLGTKLHPLNLLILSGLLKMIYSKKSGAPLACPRPVIRQRLLQAYQRGRQSNLDPDTWEPERFWELSLVEVQAIFRI